MTASAAALTILSSHSMELMAAAQAFFFLLTERATAGLGILLKKMTRN
jgi:hypothetical protein